MKDTLYKFEFLTEVHFGINGIDNCEVAYRADTFYSALCQEAIKIDCLEQFYTMTSKGEILLSDLMPYMGDKFFIPKPCCQIKVKQTADVNIGIKKKLKKMTYIPIEELENFMQGKINTDNIEIENLGQTNTRTQAAVRIEGDTIPYHLETYHFNEGNGLYVIIRCQSDENRKLFEQLLEMLEVTGIGGERNNGLGKFNCKKVKEIPLVFEKYLNQKEANTYISLSLSMPTEEELPQIIDNATYLLVKRSGFIDSTTYADKAMKKKDFYTFAAGACFSNTFKGDIYDVSNHGKHPVYRYAKPIFVGVKKDE